MKLYPKIYISMSNIFNEEIQNQKIHDKFEVTPTENKYIQSEIP